MESGHESHGVDPSLSILFQEWRNFRVSLDGILKCIPASRDRKTCELVLATYLVQLLEQIGIKVVKKPKT
jgi:hypothetical protein